MQKVFILLILTTLSLATFAQNKVRSIDELIDKNDPGWPLVQQWINKAKNKVEVLSCDTAKAKDALFKTQVTTRSPMGAIVYASGGLLIDGGWIRILGSGHSKLNRTLPDWNKGKSLNQYGEQPPFLLVADDACGGFFAINGGGLGNDPGKIYYLSQDNLEWGPLNLSYTDFLNFCFNGDLVKFYSSMRWKGWKTEVEKLDGNMTFNFFPYLWTKEGKDINKVSRMPVPIEEQYRFMLDLRKQLGLSKNGL